jgi:hypothetical protein
MGSQIKLSQILDQLCEKKDVTIAIRYKNVVGVNDGSFDMGVFKTHIWEKIAATELTEKGLARISAQDIQE